MSVFYQEKSMSARQIPTNTLTAQGMFCHYRAKSRRQMISSAKEMVMLTHARTLASSPTALSSYPVNVRPSNRSFVTMTTTTNNNNDPHEVDAIFQRKHSLRSKLRKDLKNMDPIRRSEEGPKILCYSIDFKLFVSLPVRKKKKKLKQLCIYLWCYLVFIFR